jgi:DNA adenine methylase
MNADKPVLPFLKWPGGKRWAGHRITDLIRERLTGTYYEPFLGGGAVFFELRPPRAVLSDINPELVNTYRLVRDSVEEIISRLKKLPVNKQTYNRLREVEPDEPILRAVRFLYLNRTAFGGIYRLNLNGKFNVPYGGGERTPAVLWERTLLKNASEALASAELRETDFELVIDLAKKGDVVYCDPTYTVAHDCNGFVRYNERNFSWADQIRLADAARRARQRGAVVIISNANHRTIRRLYPEASFNVLQRLSLVSPDVTKRRSVQELLVRLA